MSLLGCNPWFERVPSSAQLADKVSRGDMSVANAEHWRAFRPDLEEVWSIVVDAVEREAVASLQHATAILAAVRAQRAALGLCAF